MNITEKTVYQVLLALGDDGLTVKELLLALNQRAKKKAQLRKALKKLSEKNLCFKKDNHYFLKDRSSAFHTEFQNKKKANRPGKKSRKTTRFPEGIFLNQKGKPEILALHKAERYPLAPEEGQWLLHGDRLRFSLKKNRSGVEIALPLELLDRSISLLKGRLEKGGSGQWFFKPHNRCFPKRFKVAGRSLRLQRRERDVFLDITSGGTNSGVPEGRIDESISSDAARESIIGQILSENRIPVIFSRQALKEASDFPSTVRLDPAEKRRDLRHFPFVTIDGADARDFDDAIYAETTGNNYRIWISIADVAAYVKPNSRVDTEALKRGTSTYLPGRAIPMLPPALSNGLCSLKAGVNRKTVTCEILVDSSGEVLDTEIYESINRIHKRLTYDQVDDYFRDGSIRGKNNSQLEALLTICRDIAEILEKRRRKRGAVDFQMPETIFAFDPDNRVSGIGKSYQTKAMRVIEQFMLEANEAVARFCDKGAIPIMWRNHPPPLPEKVNDLKRLFWNSGLKISGLREGADFNRALRKCRHHPDRDLLEHSTLRTMSLAGYQIRREGHFGLAATHYCHFTSPIRRYPDLIVHRGVKAKLKGYRGSKVLERMALDLSARERQATKAERMAVKFNKMVFIGDRIGDIIQVKVSGLHWKGLFVEMPDPYVEGFVRFSSVADDSYDYDERNQQVIGRKTNRVINYGTEINVMLTSLDRKQFMPEFIWLSWVDESD